MRMSNFQHWELTPVSILRDQGYEESHANSLSALLWAIAAWKFVGSSPTALPRSGNGRGIHANVRCTWISDRDCWSLIDLGQGVQAVCS